MRNVRTRTYRSCTRKKSDVPPRGPGCRPLACSGLSWPAPSCPFRIQQDMSGTKLLDRKYEAVMANPTASDSGTKRLRTIPVIKKDGMNTEIDRKSTRLNSSHTV